MESEDPTSAIASVSISWITEAPSRTPHWMFPPLLAAALTLPTEPLAIAVWTIPSGTLPDRFAIQALLMRNATAEMSLLWPPWIPPPSPEWARTLPSNADQLAVQEKSAAMLLEAPSRAPADGTTPLLASRMPLASIRHQLVTAAGPLIGPFFSASQVILLLTRSSSRT